MEKLKRRNPVVAFLISLLLPGLGHVYNGQWVRGVACYIGMLLLNVAFGLVALAHWFYGLCIALVISIGASILIAADAAWGSARIKEIALKPYNKWYVYVILGVVLGLGSLFCDRLWQIKPYKIPSAAMEPTLLVGDRIMTQLNTFLGHKPTRGDIVVFPYPENPSYSFVMRVVGLEGETLEIRRSS